MFVIPKRGGHPPSTDDQIGEIFGTYRDALTRHRTRNASAYFGLSLDWIAEKANGLYPAIFTSGAHLVYQEYAGDRAALVQNEYHTVRFRGGTESDIESWRTSVELMIENLKVMTTWLRLNDEDERITLQLGPPQIVAPAAPSSA